MKLFDRFQRNYSRYYAFETIDCKAVTEVDPLPEGIVHKVFSFLHPQDLCKCSLVSKKWKAIIDINIDWNEIFFRFFGQKQGEETSESFNYKKNSLILFNQLYKWQKFSNHVKDSMWLRFLLFFQKDPQFYYLQQMLKVSFDRCEFFLPKFLLKDLYESKKRHLKLNSEVNQILQFCFKKFFINDKKIEASDLLIKFPEYITKEDLLEEAINDNDKERAKYLIEQFGPFDQTFLAQQQIFLMVLNPDEEMLDLLM